VRIAVVALVAATIFALGILQCLGSVAVRASAERGAWVGFVPPSIGRRVDALETALPLPEALRIVLARHALERGDLDLAARDIARVRSSRDRLALEGGLAEARHDPTAAIAAYLAAGDLAGVRDAVEARVRGGNIDGALALQGAVIVRLQGERTQADALAEAYFELGVLQQTQAYGFYVETPQRRASEVLALHAYLRAVALAPLSLRYLIALGNQQLNLGQLPAASRNFARAHEIDPTSAEPLAGLADAALRRGDTATARSYFTRARALAPSSSALLRLARRLGA